MKKNERKRIVRRGARLLTAALTLTFLAACVCCGGCILVSW